VVNDRDNELPSDLRTIVRKRRASVFRHLDEQFQTDLISEVMFDLLVHLALNADVELSPEVVDSYLWRYELDDAKTFIQLKDGRRLRVIELLEERHVVSSVEMVNALLCHGFARKLKPLPTSDRSAYCQRIVGLLPALERVGPYVLTDFMDLALTADDARYFWQLYTERIGAEISKRGNSGDRDYVPWLLHHLLILDQEPESFDSGLARMTLYRHIDRILLKENDRSRCIRQFIEQCEDDLTMRRLGLSAEFVGDSELLAELVTRGDEDQISLALYSLQVHGEIDDAVALILERFREQSLADVAHRLTEVFAQVHIPTIQSRNLQRLSLGIKTVVLDKIVAGESVETLAQAISPDERSFRHCMLVASLAEMERFQQHPSCLALLDRVLTTFFQSFSPYGTMHVLNTNTYRQLMSQTVYVLLAQGGTKYRERFEDFGLQLESVVSRWLGPEEADQERGGLFQAMISYLLSILMPTARKLCSEASTREHGLSIYKLLLHLYVEHRSLLNDTLVFGSIPHVVDAVFPAMFGREFEEIELGYVVDAVHTVARLDSAYGMPESGRSQVGFDDAFEKGADVSSLSNDSSTVSAPVILKTRQLSVGASLLRTYLGLEFISECKEGLLSFLGIRRSGHITLTHREVIVSSVRKMGDRVLERTGDSHSIDDLQAVRVHQNLRLFYLMFSVLSLIAGGLIGGHLLFVGLRGADTTLSVLGAMVILLAIIFDLATSRIMTRNHNNVQLELIFKTAPQKIIASIDTQTGAPVLDAFLANDAQRRELELLDGWNEVAAAAIQTTRATPDDRGSQPIF
jgi:hypothetical protein